MKKLFALLFLLVFFSWFTHAQNQNVVRFLTIGNDIPVHTTYEQFLTIPKINCKLKNCEVTNFTMDVLLRSDMLIYTVKGSALPRRAIDTLNKLASAGTKCKILIETIKVNHNGKNVLMPDLLEYYLK